MPTALGLFIGSIAIALIAIASDRAFAVNCTVPAPDVHFGEVGPTPPSGQPLKGQIIWTYFARPDCWDVYNVRVGIIGGSATQSELEGRLCSTTNVTPPG